MGRRFVSMCWENGLAHCDFLADANAAEQSMVQGLVP
jgi:hypothetical protein